MDDAALLGHPELRAHERLRGRRAEGHDQFGPQGVELGGEPGPAGVGLAAGGLLVDAPAARLELRELEVLDRVGDVDVRAVDAGPVERPVEQAPGGAGERLAGRVLDVAGLLPHHDEAGPRGAGAEHRLRRVAEQVASLAGRRGLPQPPEVLGRRDEPLGAERAWRHLVLLRRVSSQFSVGYPERSGATPGFRAARRGYAEGRATTEGGGRASDTAQDRRRDAAMGLGERRAGRPARGAEGRRRAGVRRGHGGGATPPARAPAASSESSPPRSDRPVRPRSGQVGVSIRPSRRSLSIRFNNRDTCICEIPTSAAICVCVISPKYRNAKIRRSREGNP